MMINYWGKVLHEASLLVLSDGSNDFNLAFLTTACSWAVENVLIAESQWQILWGRSAACYICCSCPFGLLLNMSCRSGLVLGTVWAARTCRAWWYLISFAIARRTTNTQISKASAWLSQEHEILTIHCPNQMTGKRTIVVRCFTPAKVTRNNRTQPKVKKKITLSLGKTIRMQCGKMKN